MKRFYSCFLLLALMISGSIQTLAQSTTGKVYVGYAKYDDQIWEYDGLSLDHNAKAGCAILLTKEMLTPYVGGTITGMRVGWDTSTQSGTYEAFVRKDFNSEDLTTGNGTVKYNYSDANPGWNTINLTEYEIPEDVDQLVVGFFTNLKKDVCAIPTLYPHDTPNSCYLWVEGDNDEQGNPKWMDMKERGILPILLIIKDSKGTFNYVPAITMLTDDGVQYTGEAGDLLMRIKNMGSVAISSIELTSRQGEETWHKSFTVSAAVGATSSIFKAPIYCFHTGDVELSITKVNKKEIANPVTRTVNIIGVPKSVASQYTRRPLVEYFESENNYRSARYYDDYVKTPVTKYASKITFICQHLDDQFMTGDDDATVLSLLLCDGDSSKVSIPAMSIDRAMSTDNISYQYNFSPTPMFDVLVNASDAQNAFAAAAKVPTFVGLTIGGELAEDNETMTAKVEGNIAEGILPEGEQARLTVYLMERDVDSDSQLFWNEKEKEQYNGNVTHPNVIREILTPLEGMPLAEGNFEKTLQTLLDPNWDIDNLYLVGIVHRDGKLGGKRMHVFNTAKGNIVDATDIHEIKIENIKIKNDVYDLTGRKVAKPTNGIYINGNKKVVIRNS